MKNNLKFWNIKASVKESKVLEMYIYGEIKGGITYDYETDTITKSKTSAEHIREEIEKFGKFDRLELHINSMGGSVVEANAIANMIRRMNCETVAFIDAFACSAASAIACACRKVIMPRNTVMMIHNPWTIAIGNAKELRKAADDLDVMSMAFKTIYLDKAGDKLSDEKLTELLEAETYLTAEQAKEIGLCDEIEAFDVDIEEPDDEAKKAAVNNHVNIDKICAMIKPVLQTDAESQEDKECLKNKNVLPQPEPNKGRKSEPTAFLLKADALISEFIK